MPFLSPNPQPQRPCPATRLRGLNWGPPRDYWAAMLIMAAATLIALGIDQVLTRANVLLVFLIGVLAASVRTGVWPALLSSVFGFLAYNYLFTEPYHSFEVMHQDDLLTLGFFLLLSGVTGNLAARLRQQILALQESQGNMEDLLVLSRKLAAAPDRRSILRVAAEFFQETLGADVVLLQPDREKSLAVAESISDRLALESADRAAADWAWEKGAVAGRSTETLCESRFRFMPLVSERGPLAVIGLRMPTGGDLPPERWRHVEGLCRQVAQALERSRLVEELEKARIQGETGQLRSALLSSVSHDLKTPLASMIGATTSLIQYHDRLSPEDRLELLEATLQEAERQNRYIQNLLDMTSLGDGKLTLLRDWVSLADIVGSATHRLKSVLGPFPVRVRLDPGIPLLYVHAALIEQALVNILENAARFSTPGDPIFIRAFLTQGDLILDIVDRGPGIATEEREKVFDMFYSITRGDRRQSTGLGLAICQGMVGAHGGRVEALDGPGGRGTRMRVTLPLRDQPPMPEDADG